MIKQAHKVQKPVNKNAKALGAHGSIRAIEQKRKQVYKPVLDNPYIRSNNWPHIEAKLGSDLTELLCNYLEPIGEYKRYQSRAKEKDFTMEKPDILPHVTVGFNSTVKILEDMSLCNRQQPKKKVKLLLSMIFVCRADITPNLLTQHFPMLAHMASGESKVKLIQLPRGSMQKLSRALDEKNVGIIGLSSSAPEVNVIKNLVLEQVDDVHIPWLNNLKFQSPNIKLLVTTQPVIAKKNNPKPAASKHTNTGSE